MYRYPLPSTRRLPTIAQVMKDMRLADQPSEQSRDVRRLMASLALLRQNSPDLLSYTNTRAAAISSFPFEVTAMDPADAERAAMAQQRLARVIARLARWSITAPCYGQAVMRLAWRGRDAGGLWVPVVDKEYHPTEVERNTGDAYPNGVAILEDSGSGFRRVPAVPADPGTSYFVDVYHETEVGGLLRSVLPYHVAMLDAVADWVSYNKRLKGLALAKTREGALPEEQDEAADVLAGLGATGFAVGTDAVEYAWIKFVADRGDESYKGFIQMVEWKTEKLILGQSNATGIKDGGSYAAMKVLDLVRQDVIYSDIQRIEELINDQVVAEDYKRNYGEGSVCPWRFRFVVAEPVDYEARARTAEALTRAGVQLAAADVLKQTGFRLPEQGEPVLGQPPAGGV